MLMHLQVHLQLCVHIPCTFCTLTEEEDLCGRGTAGARLDIFMGFLPKV